MRGMERLRFGPCFKHSAAFPNRVRGIERVILSLGAFEKVKFDKARHLVEMTIARQPHLLECGFGPLGNSKTVHRDKHVGLLWPGLRSCGSSARRAFGACRDRA